MGSLCKGPGSRSPGGVNLGGYLHKPRHCVIKETLVGLTEIAFSAKVILIEWGSVFHTSAATDGKVSADKAFVAEVLLGSGKFSLFAAGGQLFYRRFKNVAQSPLRLDEKITAKSIAGMLNYNILTALFVERANCMFAGNAVRDYRIKVTNAQILRGPRFAVRRTPYGGIRPIFVPAVKQPAQKAAVLLRRNRKVRNFARRRVNLHTRNKL
jgi:hypothetical protein